VATQFRKPTALSDVVCSHFCEQFVDVTAAQLARAAHPSWQALTSAAFAGTEPRPPRSALITVFAVHATSHVAATTAATNAVSQMEDGQPAKDKGRFMGTPCQPRKAGLVKGGQARRYARRTKSSSSRFFHSLTQSRSTSGLHGTWC
jgi:hypothetical protein